MIPTDPVAKFFAINQGADKRPIVLPLLKALLLDQQLERQ
jgi:hypothetical protein